jgi:hypothetical protein
MFGSFFDELTSDVISNIERDVTRIRRKFTSVPRARPHEDVMQWYNRAVIGLDPQISGFYLACHFYLLCAPLVALATMKVVLLGVWPMMLIAQTVRYMVTSKLVAEWCGRWSFIRAVKIATFLYFINFCFLASVVGLRPLVQLGDDVLVLYHECLLYIVIASFLCLSRMEARPSIGRLTWETDYDSDPSDIKFAHGLSGNTGV